MTKTKTDKQRTRPYLVSSEETGEDAEAYYFRCEMSDGRTITMTIPKGSK